MELFLLFMNSLLGLVELIFVAVMFRRLCCPSAEAQTDKVVEQAQERQRDLMNEGIENIMTYSVNGKTGFEPEN